MTKVILFLIILVAGAFILSGCQLGYLASSSYYQLRMLSKRESLDVALKDPKIDSETKRKIRLVQEVKKFTEDNLSLARSKNYESFVLLDDQYVVYAITASYKDRLEPFTWTFPFVGKVPYKGFFKKPDADRERSKLEKRGYDVIERGVSAYSTLGWFSDPLLSSMTHDEDQDLVDTVIHETTHATVYIKGNADFNERLAVFVGGKGMEEFYAKKEGASSPAINRSHLVSADSKIFSLFISDEIKSLEKFYLENKNSTKLLVDREKKFAELLSHFDSHCKPKLKTDTYLGFSKLKLNNAILLNYKTYYQDLGLYEKAFEKLGYSWPHFIEHFKSVSDSKDPEKDLADFVRGT
jgi:predicted aminopeptidase